MTIITDITKLIQPCEMTSVFEAEQIYEKLLDELKQNPNGAGLAAPQIGILKRVCLIKHKEPILLVNPKIIETYDIAEFYHEGCLSFPEKYITTKRFNEIVVVDDIHPNGFVSTGFEAVIIQHEIGHLNQETMFNYEIKIPPVNYPCWCNSGRKYKKCHQGKKITYV